MSIRFSVIVVTLLLKISVGMAQNISMEETISYIQGKLGKDISIDIIHGVLVAKFIQEGELAREDQVQLKTLDLNSMNYDATYKVFNINCKSGNKCVDREIFINRKSTRDYNRLSFPVLLDAKGIEGMKKAISHMVRLVIEPKYSSAEPFE